MGEKDEKVKFLYDKVMEITGQVGKDTCRCLCCTGSVFLHAQSDSDHITVDHTGTVYAGYEGRRYDGCPSGCLPNQ